jgi:hypothetical protein
VAHDALAALAREEARAQLGFNINPASRFCQRDQQLRKVPHVV